MLSGDKNDLRYAGQGTHDTRHRNCRLGCFGSAVVLSIKAPSAGLVFVLEQKDFVNDRDFVTELDVHECPAYGVANMGSVCGLAAKDDAEADNG